MAGIRFRIVGVLAAALLLGAGALGPAVATAQGYDASEAENAMWAEQLAEAQAGIEAARERLEQAQTKYVRARHDDYPRGEALAELEKAVEDAREELAEAEAKLPELVEQARRAGVLPEVLRPYRE